MAYISQYQSIYDAMTTKPSDSLAEKQHRLVVNLVNAGLWERFDLLYIFATEVNSGGEALINWALPGTFDATATNSPTFTANEGFTGNGTSSYITTNWNPTDDGVNFSLNSGSFGSYCRSRTNAYPYLMGCSDPTGSTALAYSGTYGPTAWLNSASSFESYGDLYDVTGNIFVSKLSDTHIEIYRHGDTLTSGTKSNTGLQDATFYILAHNANGSTDSYTNGQLSIAFVANGISDTEAATLNTIFEEYMDALGKGVQWSTEYQAVYDAMTVKPSYAKAVLQNQLVEKLVAREYWSRMDLLYIFANETSQAALLNWLDPGTFDATAVNTPTFTSLEGFTFDGSTAYLDLNFDPGTDAVSLSQSSISMGYYARTTNSTNTYEMGVYDGSYDLLLGSGISGSDIQVIMNCGVGGQSASDNDGFIIAVRPDSANQLAYRNGSQIFTDAEASTGVPSGRDMTFGAYNNNGTIILYSDRQYSLAFVMDGISAAEAAEIDDTFNLYMSQINKSVAGNMLMSGDIKCDSVATGHLNINGFGSKYQAVYDAMTNKPSAANAAQQNSIMQALVDGGYYDRMDLFYYFAQESNSDGEALINWITPGTFDATAVNSPTFTSLVGFTGDGTSSYIDTGWDSSTNAINYTQNDATFGVCIRNEINENVSVIGIGTSAANIGLKPRYSSVFFEGKINDSGVLISSRTTSVGLFNCSRTGSAITEYYHDGVSIGTGTETSSALNANDIFPLRDNTNYSTAQISSLYYMDGISDAEAIELNSILNQSSFSGSCVGTSETTGDLSLKQLGHELIKNVTFDDTSAWSYGTAWSIGSGVITNDGTGSFDELRQNGILAAGEDYSLSLDMVYTSGNIRLVSSGDYNSFSTTDTHETIFPSLYADFRVAGWETFTGTLDNISCKEICTVPFYLEPEYATIYNRMTVKPSDENAAHQNNLVKRLKDRGYWDRFDLLYVFANETEQAALLNWVVPGSFNATAVNSTIFTAQEGFEGDSNTAHILSNYNPSTEGSNYTLNDASFGVYTRDDIREDTTSMGCKTASDESVFTVRGDGWGDYFYTRVNNVGTDHININTGVGNGLFIGTRRASNDIESYHDGVSQGSDTIASTAIPNADFFILSGEAGESSSNPVSLAFVMDGVTDDEAAEINSTFALYMNDIDKSVAGNTLMAGDTVGTSSTAGTLGNTFEDEYNAVLDEMTTNPSAELMVAQNTMVKALVDGSYWSRFDLLYAFNNDTNAGGEALINWIDPGSFDATVVNTPTFTAYEGFTGDGSTSYLTTGWNPSTDNSNISQNSTSLGVYSRTSVQEEAYDVGSGDGTDDTRFAIRWTNGNAYFLINTGGAGTGANSTSEGLAIATRTASGDSAFYMNGSSVATSGTTSTGLSPYDIYILARNGSGTAANYSTKQLSVSFAMDGISDDEATALSTIFNDFVDDVDALVDTGFAGDIVGTSVTTGDLTVTGGGSAELAGDITGTSATTGDLVGIASLAGDITGTSITTGDLVGTSNLAGDITGTSITTGAIFGTSDLSGDITGTSVLTGDLVGEITLSGDITGTAVLTGNLIGSVTLEGTTIGTSILTGALSITVSLAGDIIGTSILTGNLVSLVDGFQGDITGTSIVTGNIDINLPFAGHTSLGPEHISEGGFDDSTVWETVGTYPWEILQSGGDWVAYYNNGDTGTLRQLDSEMGISLEANTTYQLSFDVFSGGISGLTFTNYAGTVEYISYTTYSNGVNNITFTTPSTGDGWGISVVGSEDDSVFLLDDISIREVLDTDSIVSGELSLTSSLNGDVIGTSVLTGSLTLSQTFQGDIVGTSVLTGALELKTSLGGDILGISSTTGALSLEVTLSGDIVGTTTVSGDLTTIGALSFEGHIVGVSYLDGELVQVTLTQGNINTYINNIRKELTSYGVKLSDRSQYGIKPTFAKEIKLMLLQTFVEVAEFYLTEWDELDDNAFTVFEFNDIQQHINKIANSTHWLDLN